MDTRFKAIYKGATIGWFDTLAEAEQAIDAARKAEAEEEKAYLNWLQED